jgi:predicted nucleic-acid-binding protein
MIGLDTNVIVRYVTQDDPTQSAKATKLIHSLSADAPGFIAMISIVELIWVLQVCYHASKEAIAQMLETLLRTEELMIERSELIWQALRRFRAVEQVDFADCLTERCAHAADCEYIVTFDKAAAKTAGMKIIG